MISVSVVVSTRDRPGELDSCLEAVKRQSVSAREVIVVDSAPRRSDAAAVAARHGARYVRLEQPGLSRARNRGVREASGDVIVFLDDDVTVDDGCLSALAAEFSDERVAAASGRIRLTGGDDAARAMFEAMGGFDPGSERRVVDRTTPGWFELVNFGGLGTGAMLAVRRTAFDDWPGFDERLGRGGLQDGAEENHAYFSLVIRGHRLVYSPNAVATHAAPGSLEELRRRLLTDAAGASAYMTLLAVEHAAYRSQVFKYVKEALTGKRRDWRPGKAAAGPVAVPRWRLQAARMKGPLLYGRMRLAAALQGPAAQAAGQVGRRASSPR